MEQTRSGALKVPKEELEGYLHDINTDTRRDEVMQNLEGLVRPTEPGVPFDLSEPEMSKVEAVLRQAREASAPEPSRVPHKVIKSCGGIK